MPFPVDYPSHLVPYSSLSDMPSPHMPFLPFPMRLAPPFRAFTCRQAMPPPVIPTRLALSAHQPSDKLDHTSPARTCPYRRAATIQSVPPHRDASSPTSSSHFAPTCHSDPPLSATWPTSQHETTLASSYRLADPKTPPSPTAPTRPFHPCQYITYRQDNSCRATPFRLAIAFLVPVPPSRRSKPTQLNPYRRAKPARPRPAPFRRPGPKHFETPLHLPTFRSGPETFPTFHSDPRQPHTD
jgi:hypothetical protein